MPADGTALTSTLRVLVKLARMTRKPTFGRTRGLKHGDAQEGRC